jgi:hypothetical protein
MYEVLRLLKVDASPTRSVEWCYPTTDGGLVVTIWHDHIQKSREEAIVYHIPIDQWAGTGGTAGKGRSTCRVGGTFCG